MTKFVEEYVLVLFVGLLQRAGIDKGLTKYTFDNYDDDTQAGYDYLVELGKRHNRYKSTRGYMIVAIPKDKLKDTLREYRENDQIVEFLYDHSVLFAKDKDKAIPQVKKGYSDASWVVWCKSGNTGDSDYELSELVRDNVYRVKRFPSSAEALQACKECKDFSVTSFRISRKLSTP